HRAPGHPQLRGQCLLRQARPLARDADPHRKLHALLLAILGRWAEPSAGPSRTASGRARVAGEVVQLRLQDGAAPVRWALQGSASTVVGLAPSVVLDLAAGRGSIGP